MFRQLWEGRACPLVRWTPGSRLRPCVLPLLLAGVLSGTASAQPTGAIAGRVVDDTGSVLPGTTVTVSAPGTTRVVYTDADGAFEVDGLPAGTYRVTASLAGFNSVSRDVEVGTARVEADAFTLGIASIGETVVVSASRVETTILNAPATMSVITSDTIASAPSQNFGDLLRTVPGVNVVQMSARDVNVTGRQATSTLSTSQLVLVDGRSVYLDFFGFVAWDFVPTDPNDIKQIEVVRGPASAVWGANALTGVVNIITKSPRENPGGTFSLNGGLFSRDAGSRAGGSAGSSYGVSAGYAAPINDAWAYRLKLGYFNSDAFSRPVGQVPIGTHPLDARVTTGGAPYPLDGPGAPGQAFANPGTSQPKVDLRLDQVLGDGGVLTYSGGVAGTSGIIHTGVGPFAIEEGSRFGFGRVAYARGALRVAGFANILDAQAPNLLLTDPSTGRPLRLDFKTRTYDLEATHASMLGTRHVLSYGGNVRRNNFAEISLAPEVENRTEIGAYLQDEFFVDRVRIAAGLRVDKFGNIDDPMVAPRISATFKPAEDQSIRVSWNRAFRSPSAINNFLQLPLFAPVAPIDLRPLQPLLPPPLAGLVPPQPVPVVVNAVGNRDLEPESLTAIELAYTATINNRTTVGVAWYQNDTRDNINFTTISPSVSNPGGIPPFDPTSPTYVYTPANSTETGIPGPLYQTLLALQIPGFPIPRTVATYLNLSGIRQRGIELSIDHRFDESWSTSVNYSRQANPRFLSVRTGEIAYPAEEAGIAARHRFNASVNWNSGRYVASGSLNGATRAFWTDVLGTPYAGYSDGFAMLNGYFGVRWLDGRVTTALKGMNLANQDIQQHVFGDILKRSATVEMTYRF
jgi:outer membrane receptor for ferrienterochelin and colicins